MDQPNRQGIVAEILDLSFSTFITTRLIKVLMVLGLVLIGLWSITAVIAAFSEGFGNGVLALLLVPLIAAASVLALRVYLELIIVIFRIAENTTELVRLNRRAPAP